MAQTSLEQRKKVWDKFSTSYGEVFEEISLPAAITLSRMAKLWSGKQILEVGCGTGSLALFWLDRLPPGTRYTAMDVSDGMIKIAQNRKDNLKHKPEGVELNFVVGDAENLDFVPDESVDVLVAPLCFHLLPNPKKAFSEAMRVLKKGGRIGVSVNEAGEKNNLMQLIDNRVKELKIEAFKRLNLHLFGNKDQLIQVAEEAGVKVDFCWDQDSVYEFFEEDDVIKSLLQFPGVDKLYNDLSEELKVKFIEGIKKELAEDKSKYIPRKSNFIFLVGKKPE